MSAAPDYETQELRDAAAEARAWLIARTVLRCAGFGIFLIACYLAWLILPG